MYGLLSSIIGDSRKTINIHHNRSHYNLIETESHAHNIIKYAILLYLACFFIIFRRSSAEMLNKTAAIHVVYFQECKT